MANVFLDALKQVRFQFPLQQEISFWIWETHVFETLKFLVKPKLIIF